MNRLTRFLKTFLLACTIVYIMVLCAPFALAWGDNNGGRRSYTQEEISGGALGNAVVLNSLSDGVFGDERNFVAAKSVKDLNHNPPALWSADSIFAEDGQSYIIRLYVHNDNPLGFSAAARDVKVRFDIPGESAAENRVLGYITSSNALPSEYWDGVTFESDGTPFHLEYFWGSAQMENNGIGASIAANLPDEIIESGGAFLGYEALDGNIPGGFQYVCYVGIRVKVVYDYDATLKSNVRLAGDVDWVDSVVAMPGDRLEFSISYTNTSALLQKNIVAQDILPSGMRYVENSTYFYGSANEKGAPLSDGIVTDSSIFGETDDVILDDGIYIGDCAAGETIRICFEAIVSKDEISEDSDTLVNWARAGVENRLKTSYVTVSIDRSASPWWKTALFIVVVLIEVAGVVYYGRRLWIAIRELRMHSG